MIKAAGSAGDGTPLLLLGLADENLRRLRAGEPVHIRAADLALMGLPGIELVITHGKDEAAVLTALSAHGVQVRDGLPVKTSRMASAPRTLAAGRSGRRDGGW